MNDTIQAMIRQYMEETPELKRVVFTAARPDESSILVREIKGDKFIISMAEMKDDDGDSSLAGYWEGSFAGDDAVAIVMSVLNKLDMWEHIPALMVLHKLDAITGGADHA